MWLLHMLTIMTRIILPPTLAGLAASPIRNVSCEAFDGKEGLCFGPESKCLARWEGMVAANPTTRSCAHVHELDADALRDGSGRHSGEADAACLLCRHACPSVEKRSSKIQTTVSYQTYTAAKLEYKHIRPIVEKGSSKITCQTER